MFKHDTQQKGSQPLRAARLIIVTNRGPLEYQENPDKTLHYGRNADGIATALIEVGKRIELTWIAAAISEGDRVVAQMALQHDGRIRSPLHNQNIHLRYVTIAKQAYRKHYEIISNQLLWFLQHYLYDPTHKLASSQYIQDAWENGYCLANSAFADAVSAELERENSSAVIMLHDYHLYLAAALIRKAHPQAIIQHFIHIPWPDIRYWCFLPYTIVQSIYTGLAGNDIIGFQTALDAHNFLAGAQRVLQGAVVRFEEGSIWWNNHRTLIRSYPISISVDGERTAVQSTEGQNIAERIYPYLNEKTIMRVDRIEPAKNIVQGFQAYEQMLDEHPELLGKVNFLAFLVPSRQTLLTYRRYQADVLKIIKRINQKYGLDTWTPIHVFIGNDRLQALVAMQFYDILLVNSLIDGMNLVAKEGTIVNQRNGILLLSRTTGVFQQLEHACIPISSLDVEETAYTLYLAITLPEEERKRIALRAKQIIEENDLDKWLMLQYIDINALLDL